MKWILNNSGPREYYSLENRKIVYSIESTVGLTIPEINEKFNSAKNIGDQWFEDKIVTYDRQDDDKGIDLPPGPYSYGVEYYPIPERLEKKIYRIHEAYTPIINITKVIEDIDVFLKNKNVYEEMDVPYRRGYLLYGPPGNGKTALIRSLLNDKIFNDAVIIWCSSIISEQMREALNRTDKLKIIIFEELLKESGEANYDMQGFLDMLDGESSLTNCITIATTNYPELLAKNLADRPSRFDLTVEVGYPDKDSVIKLFETFLKKKDITLEVDTTDLSVAHIKEIALMHKMYNISLEEATNKMRKQSRKFKDNFTERKSFGLVMNEEL